MQGIKLWFNAIATIMENLVWRVGTPQQASQMPRAIPPAPNLYASFASGWKRPDFTIGSQAQRHGCTERHIFSAVAIREPESIVSNPCTLNTVKSGMGVLTNKCDHQATSYLADVLGNKPDGRAHLSRNADGQLGVQVSLFVRPAR